MMRSTAWSATVLQIAELEAIITDYQGVPGLLQTKL